MSKLICEKCGGTLFTPTGEVWVKPLYVPNVHRTTIDKAVESKDLKILSTTSSTFNKRLKGYHIVIDQIKDAIREAQPENHTDWVEYRVRKAPKSCQYVWRNE